jgi:hypothetical protein
MRAPAETWDRFWLLTLGMGALATVAAIAVYSIYKGIPADAATLLGTIVGGLLMFMREIVQAIRGFWADARTGKLTDQLAASPPAGGPAGTPDDPVSVEEVKP